MALREDIASGTARTWAARASEPVLASGPEATSNDVARVRERSRALAAATPPKLQLGYARSFCAEVCSRYWSKLSPRPKQTLRPAPALGTAPTLRSEALAVAESIAVAAAGASVEEAAFLVGRIYTSMLPEEYRARNGVYYTPPLLATRLLDLAEAAGADWRTARVLDPACGGGAFVGPVARRLIKHLRGADRRIVLRSLATRVVGYEIDPFAAWISSVFLDATLNEEIGCTGGTECSPIEPCDSLTRHGEAADFDVVIGNPPYGRVTLDASLRAVYQRSLYGHANLYGLFVDLALRRAKPEGIVALVTPTSFLSGDYFRNLRALLVATAPPISLDFVHQRAGVFDDVLQETILATFKRGAMATDVHFLDVGVGRVTVSDTKQVAVPTDARPWIVPRSKDRISLATKIRTMGTRLADWGYRVSTGPLVWNRFKPRLRDEREKGSVPIIWAEAVRPNGEFAFRAARRNHAPYFVVKDDEDFLLVTHPCVLLQRTTAKEQPRRLVAAELPQSFLAENGPVTVENHLNMLVATSSAPSISPRVLAAFLNSEAADRVFRCISGSVAVSAYELEAMPLPTVAEASILQSSLPDDNTARTTFELACLKLYEDA